MKKNLPIILIAGAVLIVLFAVMIVARTFKGTTKSTTSQDEIVPELAQSEWSVVTLTPVSDVNIPNSLGHLLDFKVQKINVARATSMDYLLVYSTSDGGQQGVPGTIKLTGSTVDKNLLLGSESSGKFRFDAGVNHGTITIIFRDGNGKSLGKLSSDFHLQSGEVSLTSVDGKFIYTLDK